MEQMQGGVLCVGFLRRLLSVTLSPDEIGAQGLQVVCCVHMNQILRSLHSLRMTRGEVLAQYQADDTVLCRFLRKKES